MSEHEGQLFVPSGWDLRIEDGDWSEPVRVPRGGITFSTTFTNNLSPEVYRILTGMQDPPELETLL